MSERRNEVLGKTTMECPSLDDEHRREICVALFNQVDTAKLERIIINLDVIALPLTDHRGDKCYLSLR